MLQYDSADLGVGEGLLVALARLLDRLPEGGVLELVTEHPSAEPDLIAWCRHAGHTLRTRGQHRFHIERGFVQRTLLAPLPEGERGVLAPKGAQLEAGSPSLPFSLYRRTEVWADEVSSLYQQAGAAQWQVSEIAWDAIPTHDPELEAAVGQIMTFLAENEYAALYVPARYIGQIHPRFTEVAMFLATVMADESRHIDVFTRRVRQPGIATATTQLSLATLLEPMDFSSAHFLLSVLGEGTFLDLLGFLAQYAPDEPTRDLLRRAKLDESRHVHFGIAHSRLALAEDIDAARRFGRAVEARAQFLQAVSGVGSVMEEALIIYAGGGMDPEALRRGTARLQELYAAMHEGRMRRLAAVGFGTQDAESMSRLHTPNFM
ncbi:MAG: ferritin-like domain-containing protein [Candidatus Xenobia bacterium]